MKITTCLLLAGLLLVCGCSNTYVLTLNNGGQISSQGKPQLSNGAYRFKDLSGKDQYVPEGRVREVAPASMVEEPAKPKNNKPVTPKHWYFLWLA